MQNAQQHTLGQAGSLLRGGAAQRVADRLGQFEDFLGVPPPGLQRERGVLQEQCKLVPAAAPVGSGLLSFTVEFHEELEEGLPREKVENIVFCVHVAHLVSMLHGNAQIPVSSAGDFPIFWFLFCRESALVWPVRLLPGGQNRMASQLFRNVLAVIISVASFSDSILSCFYSMTNLMLCCWTVDLVFMFVGKNLKDSYHARIAMYFVCIFAKFFYLVLVIVTNSHYATRTPSIFDRTSNETRPGASYDSTPDNSTGFAIALCIFFMVNTSIFLFDIAYEHEIVRNTIFYNVCLCVEAGAMVSVLFILQEQNKCRERHSETEASWLFWSFIMQLIVIASPFSEFLFKYIWERVLQEDYDSVSPPPAHAPA